MKNVFEAAGKWKEPEFEIGGTYFRVQKLLVMEAFALLEDIRAMTGKNLHMLRDLPEDTPVPIQIGTLILSFSPGELEIVRRQLFRGVTFKNGMAKTWRALDEAGEGMAFQHLGPLKVYEVIARAFAVNFTQSIDELLSVLESLGLNIQPQEPSTSPDPSPES